MPNPTCVYGEGTDSGVCGRRYLGATLTTLEGGTVEVCSWPVGGGVHNTHPWTPQSPWELLEQANGRMRDAVVAVLYAPEFITRRDLVILAQEINEATRDLREAAFEAGRVEGAAGRNS